MVEVVFEEEEDVGAARQMPANKRTKMKNMTISCCTVILVFLGLNVVVDDERKLGGQQLVLKSGCHSHALAS